MKISKDMKTLWQYLRKYKKKVYFIIFLSCVSSAIGAVIPYIYGNLVDLAVKETTRMDLIFEILGAWLFLSIFSNWVSRRADWKSSMVSQAASNDLTLGLVAHVMKLPMSFHKDKKMGEILQRIGRAGDYFYQIIENLVYSLGPSILKAFIGLGILAYVEWRLSLTIFITIFLYVLATIIKAKPIVKTQKTMNKAYERGYGDFYNAVYNVHVVKSSVAENFEKKRNIRNFADIVNKFGSFIKSWIRMDAWQQTIIGFGFVFAFGAGIIFLREGFVSAGELVMFVGYTSLVFQPFAHLGNTYRLIKRATAVINRALGLLKIKAEEYEQGIELKDMKGKVVFENVNFFYKKKKPVLRSISFEVKPGQSVALVGESGVGKTTMVDLISRYIFPTKGRILIDGHSVQDLSIYSLRKNIAVVPQEISLFNDTVRNNIAYGKPNASMKEIIRVAEAANAHEFIQKFPKKYKQLVGERGIKLSTGQKQRIAIARALLRNPKILILDEATSALDSVSEKLVQEALKRLIKGRTTFIIAHRLSTISHSDKIFVIKKGEIVERGSHQKLMKIKNGTYRNFYLMQSVFKDDLLDGQKV